MFMKSPPSEKCHGGTGQSGISEAIGRRYLVRIEDDHVLVVLALAAVILALPYASGGNKRFQRIISHNPHSRS